MIRLIVPVLVLSLVLASCQCNEPSASRSNYLEISADRSRSFSERRNAALELSDDDLALRPKASPIADFR
jgi:hypothetical protein